MPQFFPGRTAREIADDESAGPVVLERLLAMVTVTMLIVLVMSTLGQGFLRFMQGLSGRLQGP
jgi:hypothetical protein